MKKLISILFLFAWVITSGQSICTQTTCIPFTNTDMYQIYSAIRNQTVSGGGGGSTDTSFFYANFPGGARRPFFKDVLYNNVFVDAYGNSIPALLTDVTGAGVMRNNVTGRSVFKDAAGASLIELQKQKLDTLTSLNRQISARLYDSGAGAPYLNQINSNISTQVLYGAGTMELLNIGGIEIFENSTSAGLIGDIGAFITANPNFIYISGNFSITYDSSGGGNKRYTYFLLYR